MKAYSATRLSLVVLALGLLLKPSSSMHISRVGGSRSINPLYTPISLKGLVVDELDSCVVEQCPTFEQVSLNEPPTKGKEKRLSSNYESDKDTVYETARESDSESGHNSTFKSYKSSPYDSEYDGAYESDNESDSGSESGSDDSDKSNHFSLYEFDDSDFDIKDVGNVVFLNNDSDNDAGFRLVTGKSNCPTIENPLPNPYAITTDYFQERLSLQVLDSDEKKQSFLSTISPFGSALILSLYSYSSADLFETFDSNNMLDLNRIGNVWQQKGNHCKKHLDRLAYWICVAGNILTIDNKVTSNVTLEYNVIMKTFKTSLLHSTFFRFELTLFAMPNLIALVESRKWHWLATASMRQPAFVNGHPSAISMNEWVNGTLGGRSWYQTIKDLEESSEELFNGLSKDCQNSSKPYCDGCLFYQRRIRSLNSFSILDGPILALDYLIHAVYIEERDLHLNRPRMTERFLQLYSKNLKNEKSDDISFHDWVTFRLACVIPLNEDLFMSDEAFRKKYPITDLGNHENKLRFEQRQQQFAYLRSSAKFWFKIMDENGDGYFDTNELLAYVKEAVDLIGSNFFEPYSVMVSVIYNRLRDLIFTETNAVSLKDLLAKPGTLSIVLNVLFTSSVTLQIIATDWLCIDSLKDSAKQSLNDLNFELLHYNVDLIKFHEDENINDLDSFLKSTKLSLVEYDWHQTESLFQLLIPYLKRLCDAALADIEWSELGHDMILEFC